MESDRFAAEEEVLQEVNKICYTNINGLMTSRLEVEELLERMKPDMLILSETKWKDEWGIPIIGNGDYTVWMKNRYEKMGGGVMILTKKSIKFGRVEINLNKAELVIVEVKVHGEMVTYVGIYVPPMTNAWTKRDHDEMLKETMKVLETIVTKNKNVFVIGDFNCKEINWEEGTYQGGEDSWGCKLMTWAMENLMTQWIDKETRFMGSDNPSRLDLVFTSNPESIDSVNYGCPLGKSDHVLIQVNLSGEKLVMQESYKSERYRYNKTNFEGIREFFREVSWTCFDNAGDIEEKWSEFMRIYNDAVQRFVPKGRKNCKKGKEWFNDRCKAARQRKMDAWKRWRRKRDNNNWREYVVARNECVDVMRIEKRSYEKDIMVKCKSTPRLLYRHINGKLKRREGIESLIVDGEVYDEAEEMAEVMNKCFQTVFTEEEEIVLEDGDLEENMLTEIEFGHGEVMKLMEGLDVNKAPGPDGVSNWILKECKDQLADKIYRLVSSSLEQGKVPRDWKRANIVPIHKSGKKDNPLNYRPVSLTSVVGKLCERIVKDAWMKILEEGNVLLGCQFGFRRGRSCSSNLMSFYSRVVDIVQDRDGWVDGVYLDLKKAFDKVPHRRLLWKIKNYGRIGGSLWEWVRDYLSEREMRTVIKNECSSWMKVTSGVPQGSVLGPIMFVVYVNDLADGIDSHINLFADDAKLMRQVQDENDCIILQRDIEKLRDWCGTWQMEFNVKKCKVMEFGKSKRRVHYDYKMGSEILKKSKEEEDLGVTFTESLTPDKHINKITGEVMNLLRRIKMSFTYMDVEMMRILISSLIRPRLEYAAVVWSPHTKKNIRKLERVQRAATKMVPELSELTYEERLKQMELPTLERRRERGDLISIYRMINGLEEVDENFLILDERNTRGHGRKLRKESCRRDKKKYSFPHRVVDVWNGLSKSVVDAQSVHGFKAELDRTRYRDGTL